MFRPDLPLQEVSGSMRVRPSRAHNGRAARPHDDSQALGTLPDHATRHRVAATMDQFQPKSLGPGLSPGQRREKVPRHSRHPSPYKLRKCFSRKYSLSHQEHAPTNAPIPEDIIYARTEDFKALLRCLGGRIDTFQIRKQVKGN